ncbi:hypothetical protein RB598_009425 [Gaeumannomyces tritici]
MGVYRRVWNHWPMLDRLHPASAATMVSTAADAPAGADGQQMDQPSSPPPAATPSDEPAAQTSAENSNHTPTAPASSPPPQNGHVADAPSGVSEPPPREPSSPLSQLKHRFTEKADSVKEKKPAGGFDRTPLPDFPAGLTVRITFHGATNLPRGDFTTASSDPFVHATLTADVPRRHKEDPPLTFRTRTQRRTTEPEWEQAWVVANVPRTGFKLKCRIYDEDYPDNDDRLGNVTYVARRLDEAWEGVARRNFQAKKRVGSKRAYLVKALESAFTRNGSLTPRLTLSVEVLGRSDGPGAQMYTVGPTTFVQHFSPMIGRLTGTKVNKDEVKDGQADVGEASGAGKEGDAGQDAEKNKEADDGQTKKYDFQACEMQLQGPVPPWLYHRFVEFSRFVAPMFSSRGLRGKIMNKVLHKQHRRVYNFDQSTKYGAFEPCSTEAALQFLRLAHFDEGGRVFTYVLTLDGLFRFTETGKEFGIDMLSKHTMHSDVTTYIACSGEFFIRRSERPPQDADADAAPKPDPDTDSQEPATHPPSDVPDGPPASPPPSDPRLYQLVIDNDSGTYRPDKSCLPGLEEFLSKNFPGLGISALHWEDEDLKAMKAAQHEAKKKEGGGRVRMVLNRSPSSSSFSSSDESRLSDMGYDDGDDANAGRPARKTKKELAWDLLENPGRIREIGGQALGGGGGSGSASGPAVKPAAAPDVLVEGEKKAASAAP